jgi:hypothetical protein
MEKQSEFEDHSDLKIEKLIDEYVNRFYATSGEEILRIRHNIWSIRESSYSFNIIITSLLVIFDAILFETLPESKNEFYEELLIQNAHHTKSSKLCMVNDATHLRIIRGLEDFDYSEFAAHVEEYREIFPEIQQQLLEKYYPYDA